MRITINVDIGRTFTDCFVTIDNEFIWAKEPTTHHNLSLGFLQAIRKAAEQTGLSLGDMLKKTAVIRYATTLGMNALLERSGPRLGLITTAGFEDTIFIGKGSQWSHGLPLEEQKNIARVQKPEPLIPRHMTVGLRERIDCMGNVIIPLKEEEIIDKIQYLVDQGCEGFVVALLWSFFNPIHEHLVKKVIETKYPHYFLGNIPVVLSSEVRPKLGEYARTMTTILTAYLQKSLHEHLVALGDDLRDLGYKLPTLVVHNTGGIAKISRTKALDTCNAGPVAGLHGAHYLVNNNYDLNNVIVADMGGTSFDLGLIVNRNLKYVPFNPTIDRWWVDLSMIETASIGAGGNSIASYRADMNILEVGPRSAGSRPGSVCYDQGGEEPTVTDADLVLGYLNPEYYLGGRKKLNIAKAYQALKKLGWEMGAEPEELALMIKNVIDGHMGNEIFKETALRGRDTRDFVIFACGGAGPTHACGFAENVGVRQIYVFPFASVFCAFGSSMMDVVHIYERSKHIILQEAFSGQLLDDFHEFNETVTELQKKVLRDIRSEGFSEQDAFFVLDLEARYGTQLYFSRFTSPVLYINNEDDIKKIVNSFNRAYGEAYDPIGAYPEGGIEIETFILKAVVAMPKYSLKKRILEASFDAAYKGTRKVCWDSMGYIDTPVYNFNLLGSGYQIKGPAVIEAADTTVVIPQSYTFSMDELRCGLITKNA